MKKIVRHIWIAAMLLGLSGQAFANNTVTNPILSDLDLNIELSSTDIFLADNSATPRTYRTKVPNVPDLAFTKPVVTINNIHMYLGLASLAMGGLAGLTAPESQQNLLNSTHYQAAKASWQLGAAAVATGFYAHWDDFHIEDGLLDRDNLHILLGLAGTLGYYLAVQQAVSNYNNPNKAVGTTHGGFGQAGFAAMTIAIGFTW